MSNRNTVAVARAGRAALVCLAGFALAILSASLAEAAYGPRTSIGKDYHQWSDTKSPDGYDTGSCSGSRCYLLFQRVPRGKSLIVREVSCMLIVNGAAVRNGNIGSRAGQDFPARFTYLLPVKTSGVYWAVSDSVMHLVEAGERPVVAFFGSSDANWVVVTCSISGRLIEP